MIDPDNSVVVLIDVQERLVPVMHERDALVRNLRILLQGARILDVPILWLQQYPQGLGGTVPEVAECLEGIEPIDKICFSGFGSPSFREALQGCQRRTAVLAGIESHVCVYQTARDLLADGYGVEVVRDAVTSRTTANRQAGLERMRHLGAGLVSVEMLLFEWLGEAGSPQFKEISRLVR